MVLGRQATAQQPERKKSPSLRWCRQEGGKKCHAPPVQGREAPPSLSPATSRAASQCAKALVETPSSASSSVMSMRRLLDPTKFTPHHCRGLNCCVNYYCCCDDRGRDRYHQGICVQRSSFVAFPEPGGDWFAALCRCIWCACYYMQGRDRRVSASLTPEWTDREASRLAPSKTKQLLEWRKRAPDVPPPSPHKCLQHGMDRMCAST